MKRLGIAALVACHATSSPPPPPPPPHVQHVAPPSEITTFVHAHEHDDGAWRVYFREETNGVLRTAMLSRPAGIELVERLVKNESFVSGDHGCATDPLRIEIRRGTASLTLTENCGHLKAGTSDEVMLDPTVLEFIRARRSEVFP